MSRLYHFTSGTLLSCQGGGLGTRSLACGQNHLLLIAAFAVIHLRVAAMDCDTHFLADMSVGAHVPFTDALAKQASLREAGQS